MRNEVELTPANEHGPFPVDYDRIEQDHLGQDSVYMKRFEALEYVVDSEEILHA